MNQLAWVPAGPGPLAPSLSLEGNTGTCHGKALGTPWVDGCWVGWGPSVFTWDAGDLGTPAWDPQPPTKLPCCCPLSARSGGKPARGMGSAFGVPGLREDHLWGRSGNNLNSGQVH